MSSYTLLAAPSPGYTYAPTDHTFLTWNADIYTAASSVAMPTAGRLELVRLRLPVAASVTNVCLAMGSAGNTLTGGQCFAGLWSAAGARIGVTADQAANWGSGLGVKAMPLVSGPFACAPGDYYMGFWYNGTTGPGWIRWSGLGGAYFNYGLSSPNLRLATADTGLTTSAPVTLGAQSAAPITWWAALS